MSSAREAAFPIIAWWNGRTEDPHKTGATWVAVRNPGLAIPDEECFQAAKNETGLDHYQVRRYDAWYRHATLSMLALAFLQVCAAQRGHQRLWTTSRTRLRHDHHGRDDVGDLIAVTAAEIRRLLTAFTHPQHPGEHYQHWSRWRRHHQAQARQSHYQRRLTNQPLPMRC